MRETLHISFIHCCPMGGAPANITSIVIDDPFGVCKSAVEDNTFGDHVENRSIPSSDPKYGYQRRRQI